MSIVRICFILYLLRLSACHGFIDSKDVGICLSGP